MEKIYRSLLIISLTTYFLYILLPATGLQSLTNDEQIILTWSGYGAMWTWPIWLSWSFVFAWVPLTIGMWLYSQLIRKIFVIFVIIFILMIPFEGIGVFTGIEMMLYQLTAFFDGAILAISYFTNIGKRFENA